MPVSVVVRRRDSIGTTFDIAATLSFSGNYPDEGEALLPGDFAVAALEDVIPCGLAVAGDEETALGVAWDRATGKLTVFEGSAAGTALTEKTAAEAYPAAAYVDVIVRGK